MDRRDNRVIYGGVGPLLGGHTGKNKMIMDLYNWRFEQKIAPKLYKFVTFKI